MFVFFFNDTATTEIYTLSLHDALPISRARGTAAAGPDPRAFAFRASYSDCEMAPESSRDFAWAIDRKSTRLNSSHANISYAVFCLKKKEKTIIKQHQKPHNTNNRITPE